MILNKKKKNNNQGVFLELLVAANNINNINVLSNQHCTTILSV